MRINSPLADTLEGFGISALAVLIYSVFLNGYYAGELTVQKSDYTIAIVAACIALMCVAHYGYLAEYQKGNNMWFGSLGGMFLAAIFVYTTFLPINNVAIYNLLYGSLTVVSLGAKHYFFPKRFSVA